MGPRRKRQKISEDGAEAVTAEADADQIVSNGAEEASNDEQKKQLQQRRSLFVRSLPATVTTDDLTELFSQSYPIKHAIAVLDPATKQCKGYGFVTFADAEDAQRAKEEFNGSTLQGRKIKVEVAEPRHRDVDTDIPGHKKSVPSSAAAEAKAAREQQKRETQQPPKLIIRNLPWSIKEPEQLADLFRSYGKVKHATIPKKKAGLMAGFGFVVMRGRKNAEKAMEGVNGKEVDGRTLAVDWAVEKDAWQDLQNGAEDDEDEGAEDGKNITEEEEISEDDEDPDIDETEEGGSSDDREDSYNSDADSDAGGIEVDHLASPSKTKPESNTLFVRNLPFTCSDESLKDHFSQFGPVRYARIVLDQATERPKGTGFVCFVKESDADDCLKGVPRIRAPLQDSKASKKESSAALAAHSVLQNEDADPTGRYTMEGRVLQISRAVDRSEAARLTAEGAAQRFNRDKDKRRLYLLSEGTIPRDSPLYQKLSPSEITMREASAKQRKALIQSNPSLHLSLTRLSVRNIPRSVTSKDLKALAREAVVGFARDVKAGTRQRLSKEELARGGEEMKQAEKDRKTRAKGIVKQAKVVFETHDGGKVSEASGAGRSRGYGFIEYHTHRSALMGLRWLNGHAIDYRTKENKGKKATKEEIHDKKKRLIVEFAIENAQVVSRRSERENKARERPSALNKDGNSRAASGPSQAEKSGQVREKQGVRKRKRDLVGENNSKDQEQHEGGSAAAKDGKLARRQRIIAKKRMIRRTRRKESKT
ncbi:RNA-binding domain-containing protein [Glonium stellatum]|uniref:RNA-binding domain-containing protein n=1 Tax=Glonium stellatum TaxID=574774 RepID=A0A8E2EWN8_9PEZI|nr:RNA-binding domain-containing protein [Glonium stellatum]